MDQVLFEGLNHFGQLKDMRGRFGDLTDHLVQFQQPGHELWTWSNQMLERCARKFVSRYSLCRRVEIVKRQRHRSIVKINPGPLMHRVEVVDDNGTSRNIHAAVLQHWLVLFGEEADHLATGLDSHRVDLRQLLMKTLHPDPLQTDLRYLRVKLPPRGGINLYLSSLNGHLTTIRVVKYENSTPRHWLPHALI